jgi:putative ABC transport system permease protein
VRAKGGGRLTTAMYWWRATLRRTWRQSLALALLGGLLGAVALGAVAGAERTNTAYGRYLAASRISDALVVVNGILPGMPVLRPIWMISSLPGVVSHAGYITVDAYPVVHGHVDQSFLTDNVDASLDGEWFTQDRATVLAGRLPRLGSASEIVVTPLIARMFGTGVGGHVTYAYHRVSPDGMPVGRQFTHTYRVAAIVEIPPALVDESDQQEGAILPPGATRQVLSSYAYGGVGLRLVHGTADIPRLEHALAKLAASMQRQIRQRTHQNLTDLSFPVERTDLIHGQVQQAIRPDAAALTIFGLAATLALLILVGQALAQMLSRASPDVAVIRAVGGTRAQAALAAGLPGVIGILGGVMLALAGAVAVSPLAPVGPVRHLDPSRGFEADWLVLGPGAAAIAIVLLGLLALLGARSVRLASAAAAGRPSLIASKAAASGLPVSAAEGIRQALGPGSGRQSVPVRSTLLGSVAAVTAVVAAVVFNASLSGLITHPARYGWNWDVVIQAEAGYGSFAPGSIARLIRGQPAVAGWSEMAFTELQVDGQSVPVLGIQRHRGAVQPPTTSGRALSGPDQIQLGSVTLAQLGKHVGDSVRIGSGRFARTVRIVGTVTLPSFGLGAAEHVSLGQGAMVPEDTLLATEGLTGQGPTSAAQSHPAYPSAVAIRLAPGTTAAQRARLVSHIVSANPDQTPGGTYELRRDQALAAQVVNAQQLGGQPLALGIGLAAAAVLSLALTVLGSVRRRRSEFALMKALGMTRRQIRSVIAWQTSFTLVVAALVGGPLGVLAGRWAWRWFAGSLGAVPVTVVPALVIVLGFAALVVGGNLLTSVPAAVAARTRPAAWLRVA